MAIKRRDTAKRLDGAVAAEKHQSLQGNITPFIQLQKPMRKTNAHDYPRSNEVVAVDRETGNLWAAIHGYNEVGSWAIRLGMLLIWVHRAWKTSTVGGTATSAVIEEEREEQLTQIRRCRFEVDGRKLLRRRLMVQQ
jgi:hypothetical protein